VNRGADFCPNGFWNSQTVSEIAELVGPYRIVSKLGEGSTGVVYRAQDQRLDRPVALKVIPRVVGESLLQSRFWKEARVAAQVSHPHACRLYDILEEDAHLVLVMEFLEGESLAQRILRGPIAPQEAGQTALSTLSALAAFHRVGIVHRDLKPENILLSTQGTKILDFGLAKHSSFDALNQDATIDITGSQGLFLGTPRYASPEQFRGEEVDQRSDLFSVGAILYEMLTCQTPFPGRSFADIAHAVCYTTPPVITGSPAIAAMGRVVHRALTRDRSARFPDADSMASDLRAALLLEGIDSRVCAYPLQRMMVLPFRLLRPSEELRFLELSLPEAITVSLAGLDGLIVRSSVIAARYSAESLDLKKIASEAEVDLALTGGLLAVGHQLRITTQLVQVPSGTVLWSHTAEATTRDLLALHDDLVRRVVDSVLPSISSVERQTLLHDRPASGSAYELYLRANELGRSWQFELSNAIAMYEQCLARDPSFAPAWARLGRVRWLKDKYTAASDEELRLANEAFQKAFALNPDLSLTHNLYTYLQVDQGQTIEALQRLLTRAQSRNTDAELFSGIAHICRYCGLLKAALAAHHEARRLDPQIPTTIDQTYLVLGEYQRALEVSGGDFGCAAAFALASLGRIAEAIELLRSSEQSNPPRFGKLFVVSLRALLEGKREESLEASRKLVQATFRDPEGLYQVSCQLSYWNQEAEALDVLSRAIEGGFFCHSAMAREPWLDSLRGTKDFPKLLRIAEKRHHEAGEIFFNAGGTALLGIETCE
jgi:serine/threonine protein kinase/tetratricopeptide (TPR) repeat protein